MCSLPKVWGRDLYFVSHEGPSDRPCWNGPEVSVPFWHTPLPPSHHLANARPGGTKWKSPSINSANNKLAPEAREAAAEPKKCVTLQEVPLPQAFVSCGAGVSVPAFCFFLLHSMVTFFHLPQIFRMSPSFPPFTALMKILGRSDCNPFFSFFEPTDSYLCHFLGGRIALFPVPWSDCAPQRSLDKG